MSAAFSNLPHTPNTGVVLSDSTHPSHPRVTEVFTERTHVFLSSTPRKMKILGYCQSSYQGEGERQGLKFFRNSSHISDTENTY